MDDLRFWHVVTRAKLVDSDWPEPMTVTISVGARDRDVARSLARKHIRTLGFVVKDIVSTRLASIQRRVVVS